MKKIFFIACIMLFLPQMSFAVEGTLVDTESRYGQGPYYDVTHYDNTAYAVDGNEALIVLDVTDPSSSTTLLNEINIGCSSSDLDIDGATLVVKCPFSITFFDVTDSANPAQIATYDSSGYAVNGVKLEGDRLYLIGGNSDIAIFDATDLTNITNINTQTFGMLGNVSGLRKSGDLLYTISDYSDVRAFDISNESNIVEYTLAESPSTLFSDSLINNDTLYVAANGGLYVYDISDLNNVVLSTTIDSGSLFAEITILKSLHIVDNTLFAGKFDGWIFAFDITSPNSPVFDNETRGGTHHIYSFASNDSTLFVAYGVDGLRTLDISADALPFMDATGGYRNSIIPTDLSMSNGRILVSDETGLYHIIDVTAEHQFVLKSRMPTIQGYHTEAAEIENNIGWLSARESLHTHDFSSLNPSPLLDTQKPSTNGYNFITTTKKIGNDLYVGTSNGTIAIYDVTNTVPALISSVELPEDPEANTSHYVSDIVRYGDYVIASSITNSKLQVVDFSDAGSPAVIDSSEFSEATGVKLFVTGDKLISASDYGVFVVDITDVSNPAVEKELSELGLVTAATRIDAETLVMSSSNGLFIVDIADSSNISITQKIDNVPEMSDLAYDGIYVVGAVKLENELALYLFNQPPTTSDYDFVTDEDSELVEYVDATDPEGDELTFSIVEESTNGNVSITVEGQFTYEPGSDYNGSDSFTYLVEDSYGGSDEGVVNITVNAVNDAPVANPVSVSTTVDSAVSGSFNASDVDNTELSYEHTNPSNGSLSVSGTSFTYTPDAGFSGQDSFQYTVTDSSGKSATATVTINVTQEQESPGGGGGGSNDLWLLLLLASVVMLRVYRR